MSNERIPVTQFGVREEVPATQLGVTEESVPVTQLGNQLENTTSRSLLSQGERFADGYVIEKLLSDTGAQADIYLAQKERKKYVIKKYREGYQPSEEIQGKILRIKHPNIVEIVAAERGEDGYYEIYKYYEKGTLEEQRKLSKSFLEKKVIPGINEGLRALHREGIIHGDLKPANLFLSDDEEHVLIGDFGISVYTNESGVANTLVAGTPEYSPRTRGILNQESKSFAYDYGSFGLILIRMITGRSLFSGLDPQAINEQWAKGIRIPDEIDGRFEKLIRGLVIDDENKRFGYKEVKEWIEGQFVQIKHTSLVHTNECQKSAKPLIFGFFNDEVLAVKNLAQLRKAIEQHWEHAVTLMKKNDFRDFLNQYSEASVKVLDEEIGKTDDDSLLFKIYCEINDEQTIVYKGIDFGVLNDFYNYDDNEYKNVKNEFIQKGLLQYYLQRMGYADEVVDITRETVVKGGEQIEFVSKVLKQSFEGDQIFSLDSREFSRLDEFAEYAGQCEIETLLECTENNDLMAWVYDKCSSEGKSKLIELLKK